MPKLLKGAGNTLVNGTLLFSQSFNNRGCHSISEISPQVAQPLIHSNHVEDKQSVFGNFQPNQENQESTKLTTFRHEPFFPQGFYRKSIPKGHLHFLFQDYLIYLHFFLFLRCMTTPSRVRTGMKPYRKSDARDGNDTAIKILLPYLVFLIIDSVNSTFFRNFYFMSFKRFPPLSR